MTLPVLGCVATLTGFAGLAQAQTNDSAEGFLAALSSIPLATVVDGTTWLELEYGDPAAALPVASLGAIQGLRHHDDPARLAASRGTQQAWAQVFLATDPAAMRAAIGLGPADFGRNLALRLGRAQMAMVVFQPEAAPALQAAIAAGGYQTDTRQGHPVWWRGDEDRATDPDARDPANPFGGNLGLASRFFIADSHLYWTSEWPMLDRVLSGGDGLNSHPALAALGAALQAEGQGALVYAYAILWPSAEEGAPDLTDLLTFGRSEGGLLAAAMVADLVA
ncbi:MAG: hypothetical protein KDK00_07980, partial [Rhodobacteraceae bacterium]|nr:hypothetical protein [Paracoccaceae bacterium]